MENKKGLVVLGILALLVLGVFVFGDQGFTGKSTVGTFITVPSTSSGSTPSTGGGVIPGFEGCVQINNRIVCSVLYLGEEFEMVPEGLAFEGISFEVADSDILGFVLSVKEIEELPTGAPLFEKTFYKITELDKTFQGGITEKVEIKFKVHKAWLDQYALSSVKMGLYRLTENNQWELLPTTIKDEDGSYVYYSSQTKGWSYFVIGESEVEIEVEEEAAEEEEVVEEEAEEDFENFTLGIILVSILILLIMLVVVKRKKKAKNKK